MNDVTRTSNTQVSKAIDDYAPWSIPQLALLVDNVANCLDHGSSASACAAELRGIAKHLRTAHEPPAEQLPSAWIKGHTMHTDAGLEYDEEVVPGSDSPPGDGWHPLYSRPAECPACPEFVRMQHDIARILGVDADTDSIDLHGRIYGALSARASQPPPVEPWNSKEGGCVTHFDYGKRRVSMTFQLQQDFDAMHDLIAGCPTATKGASQ